MAFTGIGMSTVLGKPLYDAIPLLRFLQVPWRFLTIASVGTAILAGLAVGALLEKRSARAQ